MRSSRSSDNVVKDLSDCRSRLDAGIEENRRNRQVIQDINDQLQRYRKRAQAESHESLMIYSTSPPTPHTSLPSLTVDIPIYSNPPPPRHRHKSAHIYSSSRTTNHHQQHFRNRSSPRLSATTTSQHLQYDVAEEENIEELFGRLKEELFKNNTLEEVNEMLREENDAAFAVNENLRVDASNLSKQLQQLQQQQTSESMRYKSENTRYRNQLETQHRKLITLWKEFTAVKRQLHELRTTAANDMDRQMTEFTRCATLMRKAIRTSEQKGAEIREEMRREKDEVLDETLRQLNAMAENYMKSDELANERLRELKRREEEMRKLREKIDEFRDVVDFLAKVGGSSKNDDPMEVARKIKKLLTAKSLEVDESQEVARLAEKDRDRARKDAENESRLRRDAQEAERKRASVYTQRENDIKRLEDDLRKAGERLRLADDAKLAAESQASLAQLALANAHREHQQFIDEMTARHRDELATRDAQHMETLKSRDTDDATRLAKHHEETTRHRRELDEMRDALRVTRADDATRHMESEERAQTIRRLEIEIVEMQRWQTEARETADRRDADMEEWRRKLEESQEREAELRRQLAEANSTITTLESDISENQTELQEVRSDLFQMTEQLGDLQQDLDQKRDEIAQLQTTLAERVATSQQHRNDVEQIRAQYDESCEEVAILRGELQRVHDDSSQKLRDELSHVEHITQQLSVSRDEATRLTASLATAHAELQQIQMMTNSKSEEEEELRTLLDDLRRNFDKLTNDLKQREISLESATGENSSLREQLRQLEELRKKDLSNFEELERSSELESVAKLAQLAKEKQDLQANLRSLESSVAESSKQRQMLNEELELLKSDQTVLTDQLQKLKDKHRSDTDKLNAENDAERDEWRDERARLDATWRQRIAELEQQIATLEDNARDTQYSREAERRKHEESLAELRDAAAKSQQVADEMSGELRELREMRQREIGEWAERRAAEAEERKRAEMTAETMRRRLEKMEEELRLAHDMVKDRDSSIHALESNTTELIEKMEKIKSDNEKLKDENVIIVRKSEEYSSLKSELDVKTKEDRKKLEELSESLREAHKSQNQHRLRSVQLEEKRSELEASNIQLQNKVKQLEVQLLDRQAKQEVSGDLVKKMEKDADAMLRAAQKEQHRLGDLEKTRKILEEQNVKLADDLATVRAAFEAKRETSKSAISDVLVQYRKAEEKANEAAIENQKLRSQLHAQTLKIERVEQSLRDSQKRFDDLQTTLSQVQRAAMDFSATSQNRSRSVSSHRLEQHTTIENSVGVTLQFLKSRIEQLEKDRDELTGENDKLSDTLRRRDEEATEIQRRLDAAERQRKTSDDEATASDARVAEEREQRARLVESLRIVEGDLRVSRARIATLEVQCRERDALVLRLRKDVDVATGQLTSARGHSERATGLVGDATSRVAILEEALARSSREKANLEAKAKRDADELSAIAKRVEMGDRERSQILADLTEEQRNHQATRVALHEATSRNATRNNEKEQEAVHRWRDTHNDLVAKNQQLARDCDTHRTAHRDTLTRLQHVSQKSVEESRKNEELANKLLNLQSNYGALRKFEEDWRRLEGEMRDELKILRKDKIQLTAEIEELRRKTLRGDTEKKELEGIRTRLEREIVALRRNFAGLEEERLRAEKSVKETLIERRGIDKSLASMERENQQLYRNCQQLQQQIQQLEKEAGPNRSVSKLAKEHAMFEAKIGALLEEKRQLQSAIEQRDASHQHKRKLLESQLHLLREQLDAERRKRRAPEVALQTRSRPQQQQQHFRKIEYRHYYHRSSSTSSIAHLPVAGTAGTHLPVAGTTSTQFSPNSQTDSYTSEPSQFS